MSRAYCDVRIATYNIHRCRGLDGRTLPERTAEVIGSLKADVVALQEVVGAGPEDEGHAAHIGAVLGMGWAIAPTRHLRDRLFGNMVLSHFPIKHHTRYDLSWRNREPRCCQRVSLQIDPDRVLHLYNVHLGTAFLERRYQAVRLAAFVHDRRVDPPKIVLGDFNEWTRGLATSLLTERLQSIDLRTHLRRRRTYPGILPLLHLDHIYFEGHVEVLRLELPRTAKSLVASDHLPLLAELRIRWVS